jgi:DNA-binding MarR family transcriptional regulator
MELGKTLSRNQYLDDIAEALPRRAVLLARLFLRHAALGVSRTELGVLYAASERPARITDLAASEGVTQPAITLVVNHLVERGWVVRRDDPTDGRVVLVDITDAGRTAFNDIRAQFRALMHEEMATVSRSVHHEHVQRHRRTR